MSLDPAIRSYYEQRPEEERLERGASRLEAVRTRTLVERYMEAPLESEEYLLGASPHLLAVARK